MATAFAMPPSSSAFINDHFCDTPNCDEKAKLRCPNCIKLGVQNGSYFCSQECFKGYWSEHKKLHSAAKQQIQTDGQTIYNPWPGFHFTGKLRPYPQSPFRSVPSTIGRPDYADNDVGRSISEEVEKSSNSAIKVLTEDEQEQLKITCKLGRLVLDEAARALRIGMTTDEIDRIVHEVGDPLSVKECVFYEQMSLLSSNANVVYFVVDVSVYHRGYHGDLNETFLIGQVDEKAKDLVRTAYGCLEKAIELIRPGTKYRDVGNEIQKYATANGCSVVRSYCGHGIHKLFHCAPNIPHYAKNKAIGVMKPGHSFSIEPMINMGTWRDVMWPDDWTAVTEDGKLSAQFEHTFLVTDSGCDILTARANGKPWFMDQQIG
ncbi:unnamed protein product [Didymodactylos carnosus]|uniref:Methionine aminopeptidase n=1 Tax=Didymodactylos carnosus TaxID=1234261 RepID=A0A8S2DRM1_9BILA|nr:unnamed protein product [Didymodactylos carnosus]CAF3751699.1 unnamed protein product [Didymodactylos carnosus]